jgi:hypothetical protein
MASIGDRGIHEKSYLAWGEEVMRGPLTFRARRRLAERGSPFAPGRILVSIHYNPTDDRIRNGASDAAN